MTKEELISIVQNNNSIATNELKQKALDFVAQNNFPTVKDEVWKHTDLKTVLEHNYELATELKPKLYPEQIDRLKIGDIEENTILVFNGFFNRELSNIPDVANGLIVEDMSTAKTKYAELFNRNFESTNAFSENIFAAINTAFAENGLFGHIADNKAIERPINIIHLNNSEEHNTYIQWRNLIVAGENSQAKIVQTYGSMSQNFMKYVMKEVFGKAVMKGQFEPYPYNQTFTNACNEIVCKPNSVIEYNLIQEEDDKSALINTLKISQEHDSKFNLNSFIAFGALVRNEFKVVLTGEHCETNLNGLYMPANTSHFDNYIYINHAKPHCESNQIFKGIINNTGKSVFLGKVYVARDAQKTNAYQSNKNILLTTDSKAFSKPQLEIYADDVKCSHGSSTGQLDQNQLFYMQARGISKESAKMLLLQAFASDIVNKVSIEPLKNKILETVENLLS